MIIDADPFDLPPRWELECGRRLGKLFGNRFVPLPCELPSLPVGHDPKVARLSIPICPSGQRQGERTHLLRHNVVVSNWIN